MAFNLVNLLAGITAPTATPIRQTTDNNPFANPMLFSSNKEYYGKNRPIPGGYFAGYHNGKPNIVGRKLFIEV